MLASTPPALTEIAWCEGGCGLLVPLAVEREKDGRLTCAACESPARAPTGDDLTRVLVDRLAEFVGPERAALAARDLAAGGRTREVAEALRDLRALEARARDTAAFVDLVAWERSGEGRR